MVPEAEARAAFPEAEARARAERVRAEVADPAPRASAEVCGTREAAREAVEDLAPGVRPAEAAQAAVGVADPALAAAREAVVDLVREARAAEADLVPVVRVAELVPAEAAEPAVQVGREVVAQVLVEAAEAGSAAEREPALAQE